MSIQYPEANELMQAIIEKAGEEQIAVCVVDARAEQLCAAAINGVSAACVQNALAKAITAVRFERDTAAFRFTPGEPRPSSPKVHTWLPANTGDAWSEFDIQAAGLIHPNFCAWAGGSLVHNPHDGEIMGAIGVSGLDELEDQEMADHRPSGWTA